MIKTFFQCPKLNQYKLCQVQSFKAISTYYIYILNTLKRIVIIIIIKINIMKFFQCFTTRCFSLVPPEIIKRENRISYFFYLSHRVWRFTLWFKHGGLLMGSLMGLIENAALGIFKASKKWFNNCYFPSPRSQIK